MSEKVSEYMLLDSKTDYIIKKIFAGKQPENKIILVAFLQTILEEKITAIININVTEDKLSKITMKVKTELDEYIDVELQVRNVDHYRNRSIYYKSSLYSEKVAEAETYYKLKKCVFINILNFNLLQETEDYHSVFKERKSIRDIEVHYLELQKLNVQEPLTPLAEWLFFIRNLEVEDTLYKIKQRNKIIKMADAMLHSDIVTDFYRISPEQYEINSVKKTMKEEIAIKMIFEGMDSPLITKITGFDEKEIRLIKEN
ncbi:Rpn family recombination-promoting nuclease/putative transposase [Paraliobacillus zengyii]|uniref:Rpn family recombination-promoting nuclease/putative transposase n=1 Tax=Paraliobacillus zengyii TaxID=2213194 RepID=UPI000DD3A9FA|nr:Rpn family recombination-promoting nuclease/putative transposase [Paraliobacillus zengyii]